jgi:hypothetical protein
MDRLRRKRRQADGDVFGPAGSGRAVANPIAARSDDRLARLHFTDVFPRLNLCDIEKGRKGVSPEKAEQIAKAIGVPAALLIRLSIEENLRAAGLKYTVEIKPAA